MQRVPRREAPRHKLLMRYWQHGLREPDAAQRLTQAVKQTDLAMLLQI